MLGFRRDPPLADGGRVPPDVLRRRSGNDGGGTAHGRVERLPASRRPSLLPERGSAQGRPLRVPFLSPQPRHQPHFQYRGRDEPHTARPPPPLLPPPPPPTP